MLLRVILSQEDIRGITVDSVPETVDGLHLMLKNKLGLEGDLVVQFQDPEFDNELCNLSSMSELPKDKVTLKVYSKNLESYHTDSTSDMASLSLSSIPSFCYTRRQLPQLPQQFHIPTFSCDVELKLKKGNEAFHKDGTLLAVSKDTQSHILEKIAEALHFYIPYPIPEESALVSQALVDKHPCLSEPESGSGWCCWKFSLKFKMGNSRQKLRSVGCPELKIRRKGSRHWFIV